VDSVNSHGTLLAVVQVIADLNLVIRKAYFSSDGNWFMDGQHSIRFPVLMDSDFSPQKKLNFYPISVFNVTDRDGNKVVDAPTISFIQKVSKATICH
jgi:hypothetical protein